MLAIGIEDEDTIAARRAGAGQAATRIEPIRLVPNQPHATVPGADTLDDRGGVVFRGVVDHQDLEWIRRALARRQRLTHHLLDVLRFVVRGQNH